jgi:hypothetical protein
MPCPATNGHCSWKWNSNNFQTVGVPGGNGMSAGDHTGADDQSSLRKSEYCTARFSLYRNYIQHEDHLINHRISWFITVQSFLIAAFAVTMLAKYTFYAPILGASIEHGRPYSHSLLTPYQLAVFQMALVSVGFITSVISFISVEAAHRSIRYLTRHWAGNAENQGCQSRFPGLTNARHGSSDRDGWAFARYLPLFFGLFWLCAIYEFDLPYILFGFDLNAALSGTAKIIWASVLTHIRL